MTEMLAILEGIERGPAGNTALACAFSLAQSLPEDEIVVVTETEYTGAGKHIQPQLSFARENGIEIRFGDPSAEDVPGQNIILPDDLSMLRCKDADLDHMRKKMIERAALRARQQAYPGRPGVSGARHEYQRRVCKKCFEGNVKKITHNAGIRV